MNTKIINEISIQESKVNEFLQKNKYLKKLFYGSAIFTNLFNLVPSIFILIVLFIIKILNINNLLTIFFSFIFLMIIKNMIKRDRPFILNDKIKNLDHNLIDLYSFPSGHTFISMLIALYIYKKTKIYSIFFLPLVVGFSRLQLGVHYISDIVAAFILAYLLHI